MLELSNNCRLDFLKPCKKNDELKKQVKRQVLMLTEFPPCQWKPILSALRESSLVDITSKIDKTQKRTYPFSCTIDFAIFFYQDKDSII